MKQGRELDPLSPIITATVGSAYFFACKYDEAIEQFHAGLVINSNHFLLHLRLAHAYSRKGMCGKAIEEARTAVTLSGGSVETLAGLGQAYAAAGMRSEMQEVLDQLEEQAKERYVSAYYVAKIHAALGDKEQAFAWLEKAYEERNPDLIELKVEPALDCLHSDHRFADLLSRIGL